MDADVLETASFISAHQCKYLNKKQEPFQLTGSCLKEGTARHIYEIHAYDPNDDEKTPY